MTTASRRAAKSRTTSNVSGTQAIERAMEMLRLLSDSRERGLRLADAGEKLSLSKATTHRIMHALVRTGMAIQDEGSRRYFLGPEIFALSMRPTSRADIVSIAGPSLQRLAEASEDTIYLTIRSGNEGYCAERREGSFPIKTLTLARGDRRPLGMGAGNLALLAFASPSEQEQLIVSVAPKVTALCERITEPVLRQLVRTTRRLGYAFNDGLVIPGMKAVAVPIKATEGHAVAALSIAAIEARMRPDRRAMLLELLIKERVVLEQALTQGNAPFQPTDTTTRHNRVA